VIPRDSLGYDGEQAFVRVQRGGRYERQDVSIGDMSAHEVVVANGLGEGSLIARNIGQVQ
jgi:hypothetical protein